MAKILQIKRGSGSPGNIFSAGEPIFDQTGKILYIGNTGGVGAGAGSSIASADSYSAVLEMLTKASSTTSGAVKFYEDIDNGSNFITIKAPTLVTSNITLTLPDGDGDPDQVLKTDGSGNLSWANQTTGFAGFTISDGSNISSITNNDTIIFTSGEGIDAVVTVNGDSVTISGEAASTTNAGISSYTNDFYFINTWQVGIVTATSSIKGIASFNPTDFNVTSGAVSINSERIEDIIGIAITNGVASGLNTNITVTYDDANNRINVGVSTASTTTLGVASFNPTDFNVTSGSVSIKNNILGVGIATAGGIVGTGVTLINFVNSGVSTITVSSGIATINITGGSSSISSVDISSVMMSMIF